MRNRQERRLLRSKKLQKRKKILKDGGYQGGTLYDKHTKKIEEKGLGYMSKSGTLLHYARGTNKVSQKVRDRKSYNGTNNWSHNDVLKMDSMKSAEKEFYCENC